MNNSEEENIFINNSTFNDLEINKTTELSFNVNDKEEEKQILEKSIKDNHNIFFKINRNFFEKDGKNMR